MVSEEGVEQLELKNFADSAAKCNRAHEALLWGEWKHGRRGQ